ncbi:MAG TPA: hypothetical protein PKY87_16415 [Terricaulis sp.]|jgi:hypothetical protein|nr:hypothetical protein [Terricaulis sp.]HRE45540.1 hypothetical protein [Terricaulis sp.]
MSVFRALFLDVVNDAQSASIVPRICGTAMETEAYRQHKRVSLRR